MGEGAEARRQSRERWKLNWFLRLVAWDLALLHGVPSGGERCTKTPDPQRRSAVGAEVRRTPRL